MPSLTPERAAMLGRIGAFTLHSRHDAKETTQHARDTFLTRFEKEVDPDGVLPPEERARRAEYARKAYFLRLALRSAEARKAKSLTTAKKVAGNGE